MADTSTPRSPDPPASQSTRQLLDELDSLMQRMLALPVEQDEGVDEPDHAPEADSPRLPVTETPRLDGPHKPAGAENHSGANAPRVAGPEKPAVTEAGKVAGAPRGVSLVAAPTQTLTVQGPTSGKSAAVLVSREAPAARPAAPTQRPPKVQHAETQEVESAPTYLPLGAEPLLPVLLQRPKATPEKRVGLVLPPRVTPGVSARREPLPSSRGIKLKTPAPTAPVTEPGQGMQILLTVNGIFDNCTRLFGAPGRWLRGEQGRSVLGWSGLAMIVVAVIWALLQFFG